jgi:hypothetical protein
MKTLILALTFLNIIFLLMHEFDACYQGEWKMFRFLKYFPEKTQYQIFLWFHFPLCAFLLYYFGTVLSFSYFWLWILMNVFGVLHLIIHLIALKWKSNVFTSFSSFVFIAGAALTGMLNLLLFSHY